MNLTKAIEQVRALKNGYNVSDEQIRDYINTAEMQILTEIVSGREGDTELLNTYTGVNSGSDADAELFAPPPYDGIYAQFCAAQIDLLAEDGERYINDSIVFRDSFQGLKRYWWKTHRQKKDFQYHF